MGHPLYDGLCVVRKVVGGDADDNAHQKSHRRGAPDSPGKSFHKNGNQCRQNQVDGGGHVGGGIQRPGGAAVFSDSGGGDSDDGGQQAQDGVTEYHGNIGKVSSRERLGDHQCRYHGGHIGVEQIGAHTGHVTHVVAHIVGDYGRIAGESPAPPFR